MIFVSTEHEHQSLESAEDALVLPKWVVDAYSQVNVMASIVCLFISSSSPRPFERRFLLDIVQAFPIPGNSLVKTYFELLLFTEVALHMKSPVNVVVFFPTWVRGALKKGIFLVTEARQEQIPLQLQQKRVKVCVYINHMCDSTCHSPPIVIGIWSYCGWSLARSWNGKVIQ